MSDKIGMFTGSFDPVTKGHLNLIERASKLFDTLYIGLFYNHNKKGFFSLAEKEQMLREAVVHLPNVRVVVSCDELAVDVALKYGVTSFVRGLRNASDFDYEAKLQFYNKELAPKIETIFLLSDPEHQYLTSSAIRELLTFGKDVRAYVPQSVIKKIRKNL